MASKTIYINTTEAAEIIGCTPDHATRLARQRQITSQKIGRDYIVDKASAEAYAKLPRKTGPKPKKRR